MTETVPEMESKRSSGHGLGGELSSNGKRSKGSGKRSSVNGVTNDWKNGVGDCEAVESKGHGDARKTVQRREGHGHTELVDLQMRRKRSVDALFLQEFLFSIGGSFVGCDGSKRDG